MIQPFANVSIRYLGLQFNVSGTYTPATPDVWSTPDSEPGFPGGPAEADLTIVEWVQDNGDRIDVTELLDRCGEMWNVATAFLEQFTPGG